MLGSPILGHDIVLIDTSKYDEFGLDSEVPVFLVSVYVEPFFKVLLYSFRPLFIAKLESFHNYSLRLELASLV